MVRPADGQPIGSVETVTFAIYADEVGGAPIWQETQAVQPDASGRYSVLLGATQPDGVPPAVFASGDARWLGMTWARGGESQNRRSRLTFVPYAMHAADADTLGGKPASAYALSPSEIESAGPKSSTADPVTTNTVFTGGTNQLAKYVNGTDLTPSTLFESGGLVGVGTTAPLDSLHVRFTNTNGAFTGYAVQNLGSTASSYSGMLFYDHTGALGQFQGFNNSTHEYRINNIASGGSINFMLGSSSKFQVRSDGDIEIPNSIRKGGSRFLHAIGSHNTAVGIDAMSAVSTSIWNVAVGKNALFNLTTGGGDGFNVAVGGRALEASNGLQSTAVGGLSFLTNAAGNGNIGLGMFSGSDQTTGSFNMYLGYNVGRTVNESSTIRIGDSGYYSTFFAGGIRGVTTGAANAVAVVIDSNGQLGTVNSSRRYKEDIQDMGDASSGLMKLRPVTYRYRQPYADGSKPIDYGLIAEEVEQVYPDLVAHLANGAVETVQYQKINAMLLNEVQKQNREIETLKTRLAALERLIAGQKN